MNSAKQIAGSMLPRCGRILCALFVSLGLASLLVGCGSGNGTSPADESLIRSINGYIAPNGADSSIFIIGNNIYLTEGSLGFGQVANAGGFIHLTGSSLNAVASGPSVTAPVRLNGLALAANSTAYTMIFAGEAGQTGTLAPKLFFLPNYTTSTLTLPAGTSAVRVVNLSLVPNAIGLYATSSGTPTTALNAGLGSVPYGYNSAANPYVAVTTAALTNMAVVDVTHPQTALTLAGNNTNNTLNAFTFAAGQAYTLYVLGQPGNTEPLIAIWVLDYPAQ